MLDDPSFYNIGNWLSSGLFDTAKGTVNPTEPLSLAHWLDSLGLVAFVFSAYKAAGTSIAARRPQTLLNGIPKEAYERGFEGLGDDIDDVLDDIVKEPGNSSKGLVGKDFEDYLTKEIGGNGSFSKGGREFDGAVKNRWWEAKSGQYWDMLESNPQNVAKFKSDMGDRLRIAKDNGATYELFSNTPIPQSIKDWLIKKGISFTEYLD